MGARRGSSSRRAAILIVVLWIYACVFHVQWRQPAGKKPLLSSEDVVCGTLSVTITGQEHTTRTMLRWLHLQHIPSASSNAQLRVLLHCNRISEAAVAERNWLAEASLSKKANLNIVCGCCTGGQEGTQHSHYQYGGNIGRHV